MALRGAFESMKEWGTVVSGQTLAFEFTSGSDMGVFLIGLGVLLLCIAASFILVVYVRGILAKVSKTLDDVEQRTGPLLDNVNTTVDNVNVTLRQVHMSLDEVNGQLVKVSSITDHAQQVSGNVANVTTLIASAAATPLVKLAAFGFGVRRAVTKRNADLDEAEAKDLVKATRKERKRRKK
ncbi:DUF948 domain-containing protein [Natronoglycomyces albus]|uniref:DUF948 domain-containing protein n=1 Tax=Natronoglycomyces albus TaxID=2811108 RepID=A0A895XN36_9ACTN|nr:DUF948 domain-containing protein [Natronoglycomyces albus]QSB03886.1 DUF948 domain-containing protein [Natronoglycomyces albus]